MSMIDTQNGYDLGYSYCKVCEDWSQTEHHHELEERIRRSKRLSQLASMTPAELVALLPICPRCNRHEVMDGEMCTKCRKAEGDYEKAVSHGK